MESDKVDLSNEIKLQQQENSSQSQSDKKNNDESESIGKPDLPKIPNTVSERIYHESGETSLPAILFGSIPGPFVSLILSFVAYLAVALAVLFFVDFGINDFIKNGNFQYNGILQAVASGMLLVCMALIYIYTGFLTGFTVKKLMQIKNNRNTMVCLVISVLSALTGFLFYIYLGIDLTRSWKTFEGSTWDKFLLYDNWVVYTEHVLAAIMIMIGALLGGGSGDKPFCEKCGIWYEKSGQAFFHSSLAEPLIESLTSVSPDQFLYKLSSFKPKPNIESQIGLNVTIWRCPGENDNMCDYNVVAELKWKEQRMEKEEVKTYIMRESWLNTMAKNQNGKVLNKALFKS